MSNEELKQLLKERDVKGRSYLTTKEDRIKALRYTRDKTTKKTTKRDEKKLKSKLSVEKKKKKKTKEKDRDELKSTLSELQRLVRQVEMETSKEKATYKKPRKSSSSVPPVPMKTSREQLESKLGKNVKRLRKVLKSHKRMLDMLSSKDITHDQFAAIQKCRQDIKKGNIVTGTDLIADIKVMDTQIGNTSPYLFVKLSIYTR